MIGKKVLNAKGGGSKAARIGGLLDYIRAPQRVGSDEKCAYYGARGFVTDSPGGHRAEMVALAQDAARSSDPINHYILSWREGEVPLPAQVEEAVTLFLGELGLVGHQAVYGLHSDTDNLHLHIAVNRVHPETLRVAKIHGGFDLEAVHRAVARIEHAQGWLPERRARYQVNGRGEVVRSPRQHAEPRRPGQDKCDREAHTGYRSAERIAIEEAAPIIANAKSWEELHVALAERGMRYERTGSGAKIFVSDTAVKASRVAREASLGKLEGRFGPYRAASQGLQVKAVEARPLRPDLPGWERYSEQRARYYAEKGHAWRQLRARLKEERRDLCDRQRRRRAEVLSGNFAGRGQLLNTLRTALAQEQRAEARAQRHDHAHTREQLRAQYARFPGIEQWLRDRGQEAIAEQWRYRECAAQSLNRSAPMPKLQGTSTYTRFATDWQARQEGRRDALARVWSQYARDVARLKSASKQRWAAVRLVAKGPIAGKLWALNARVADQRAWRQLHERHRAALRAADQGHRPLEWETWLRASATADEHALATPPRIAPPVARAANAVTAAGGRAVAGSSDGVGATEVVFHRVPGGTVRDDGQRLTLSEGSTREAVAALLQLARGRYGARLGVDGDEAFRERIVQAAAASGLDITFADPQLEARTRQLRCQGTQDARTRTATQSTGERLTNDRDRDAFPDPGPDQPDVRGVPSAEPSRTVDHGMNALDPPLRSGTARADIARDSHSPTRQRKGRSR